MDGDELIPVVPEEPICGEDGGSFPADEPVPDEGEGSFPADEPVPGEDEGSFSADEPVPGKDEGSLSEDEPVPGEGEGPLPPEEEHELRRAMNVRAKQVHHHLGGHAVGASLPGVTPYSRPSDRPTNTLRAEQVRRSSMRSMRDKFHLAWLGTYGRHQFGVCQQQLLCPFVVRQGRCVYQ